MATLTQTRFTSTMIIIILLVVTFSSSALGIGPSDYIKPTEGDTHFCFGLDPKCMNVKYSICNPSISALAIDPAKMSVYGSEVEGYTINQVRTSTIVETVPAYTICKNNITMFNENTSREYTQEETRVCQSGTTTKTVSSTTISPVNIASLDKDECINLQVAISMKKSGKSSYKYGLKLSDLDLDPYITPNRYVDNFSDINLTRSSNMNISPYDGRLMIAPTPISFFEGQIIGVGSSLSKNASPTGTYTNNNPRCIGYYTNCTAAYDEVVDALYYEVGGSTTGSNQTVEWAESHWFGGLFMFLDSHDGNHNCGRLIGRAWYKNTDGTWSDVLGNNDTWGQPILWKPAGKGARGDGYANKTISFAPFYTNETRFQLINGSPNDECIAVNLAWIRTNFSTNTPSDYYTKIIPADGIFGSFNMSQNHTKPSNTNIIYNISCDGTTWADNVQNKTNTNCASSGQNLIAHIQLTTTNANQTPKISNLMIETTNSTGGATATESEARDAIEAGIKDNFPSASIISDQQVFLRYVNGTQRVASVDKMFANGNKRWLFNYLSGSDTTVGLSSIGTSVYVWENQTLSAIQIQQQIRDLINATK